MAAAAEEVKWLKHYSSTQSRLIVGDGDLSFSRALAIAFCSAENLVATSIDSYGLFIFFFTTPAGLFQLPLAMQTHMPLPC